MKPLTPKQQAFADAVLQGEGNSEAYRKAYAANGNAAGVARRAYEVRHHLAVAAYIAKAQAQLEATRVMDRKESLLALSAIVRRKAARDSDRIHAIRTSAEMQGFFKPTKVEVKLEGSLLWRIRQGKHAQSALS